MKFDASKFQVAIPAALIPFAVPFATIAAEGTGRVSLFNLCMLDALDDDIIMISSINLGFWN